MSSNIFLTKWSEVSGQRLDSFYYIPEIVELEKKVTDISDKKLRDFVVSISSGATPSISQNEQYYADSPQEGIPFLRVQNLTIP